MSINGVLEDLPLADVLQFIHLGHRTGTLYMWRDDDRRAEIGFHEGRIVAAWRPGQKRLGDLLVAEGVLDGALLRDALALQRGEAAEQSLGQILLSRGWVRREDVHRVIQDQIQEAVFDLVTWKHGHFHFEVNELNPVDDFAVVPGDILGDLDLNTQMLLLEATRIFDERHRDRHRSDDGETSPLERRLRRAGLATGRGSREPGEEGEAWREAGERPVEPLAPLAVRCQVVSKDPELARALVRRLPEELARVVPVQLREAGNRVPGELAPPLVVLDLRGGGGTPRDLATLSRTRPSAPLVAVIEGLDSDAATLYGAGAIAVVTGDADALAAVCRTLVRVLSHPQPQGTFGYGRHGVMTRFRRALFDVQSGLLSATMALNLMNVISESVERAILFLVQGERLVAVGAFGFSENGRSLAEVTRGLKLEPPPESALRRALTKAEPLSLDYEEAGLPEALSQIVGRPRTGQVVIFPVLGAERPISVIYTDNGPLDREIQDIKILELATSQVGVAFENELIGQQLGAHGLRSMLE